MKPLLIDFISVNILYFPVEQMIKPVSNVRTHDQKKMNN